MMTLRLFRRYSTITEWHESQVIIDRKSRFQARNVPLSSPEEIPGILKQFLAQHRSIAKNASHPHILAWRVGELSPESTDNKPKFLNIQQGFKDNGESGAGLRLLEHLGQRGVMNKLVIVTRWYGGNPIGALRFRHILNCSFDSLRLSETKK
ncbi:hypothetical protein PUMCH_001989 [Australozyma saopauloensis]|uniref:Impact N-terminal domain-containing protein n=1 Tax=Australozyma saopauloensis TaxID=291208 RepID=A0AAX4H8F8_9ASCO|nr:hypothetical protein PUMCH_001989 [[Candida] saopauloensis]